MPERQLLAPPRNTQTEATSFTMSMSTIVHVQKHGKCSNQRKLHLNDPAPLLINIIYYNLCQRSSTSKARRLHAVLAKIHGLIHGPCMHPCPNLDLLDIGQNVFTTARFNMCIDAMKKNSNALTLELITRSILK